MGKSAVIQIVDEAEGRWGHINVEGIVQTDKPEVPPVDKGLLYQESLRPQFHFTAPQWTMDRLNPGKRPDVESETGAHELQGKVRNLEILIDRGSLETFANEGEFSCTRFFPAQGGRPFGESGERQGDGPFAQSKRNHVHVASLMKGLTAGAVEFRGQ